MYSFDLINFLKESIFFLVPVIISIYTFIYIRKTRFYFIEFENIQLFNKKSFELPDFKIQYKHYDANENFKFVKGSIILKGVADVKPDEIYDNLKISISDDGGIWEDFNIISSSQNMKPEFEIHKNKIIFDKILFKNNDCINFEGVYTSKSQKLELNHRFYNVASEVLNINSSSTRNNIFNLGLFFIVLFCYLFFLFSINKDIFPQYFKSLDEVDIYDFNTIIYNDKNEIIDIDNVPKLYKYTEQHKENLESYHIIHDSLQNVLEENESYDNFKNLMTHKFDKPSEYDGLTEQITLMRATERTLKDMIITKKLRIDLPYKYNDTLYYKFQYKNSQLDEDRDITIGLVIINILFVIATIYLIYAIPRAYIRYYTLNKIINKTNKN